MKKNPGIGDGDIYFGCDEKDFVFKSYIILKKPTRIGGELGITVRNGSLVCYSDASRKGGRTLAAFARPGLKIAKGLGTVASVFQVEVITISILRILEKNLRHARIYIL